jgi:predicted nucleic acid-binding protein
VILVDTSIWVELLAGRMASAGPEEAVLRYATCGPVVQEVLQGLRAGPPSDVFREAFLTLPLLSDPIPLDIFTSAAEICRQGRRRGITIRSSTDCLIAAIAIRHAVPVWHRDRDYPAIATYTKLETITG